MIRVHICMQCGSFDIFVEIYHVQALRARAVVLEYDGEIGFCRTCGYESTKFEGVNWSDIFQQILDSLSEGTLAKFPYSLYEEIREELDPELRRRILLKYKV